MPKNKTNETRILSRNKGLDQEQIIKTWRVPGTDYVAPTQEEASRQKRPPTVNKFNTMIQEHIEKIKDAEGQMELSPDLILVRETVVSTILSPKNLQETELDVTIDGQAPAEMAEIIRKHFTEDYNLNDQLSTMLADSIFDKGSHISLVVPSNAISALIQQNNYSYESIVDTSSFIKTSDFEIKNVGLLDIKANQDYSFEGINGDLFNKLEDDKSYIDAIGKNNIGEAKNNLIEISDNILHLVLPAVTEIRRREQTENPWNSLYGFESIMPISETKNNKTKKKPTAKRTSFIPYLILPEGNPLKNELNPIVFNLPPESVIPVHVPGQPSNHIGYFIVLDKNSNPITGMYTRNRFKDLNERLDVLMKNQSIANNIAMGVTYPLNGGGKNDEVVINDELLSAYNQIFDNKLQRLVENGTYGSAVEIGDPGEFYRIVLFRQLSRQKTKLVYVPANLVSYMAFSYSNRGIGVSMLEKTKLYSSFRAILMFASIIANVNNSINRTLLTINLSDKDPDQRGTVETILTEHMNAQSTSLPIGSLNPIEIGDSIQKSGTQVKIVGAGWPETDVSLEEVKRNITPPQQDVMDYIQDIQYNGFWVNRETISNMSSIQLATTIVSSNIMQARRFQNAQKIFVYHISERMKKYIRCGGPLYKKLLEAFNKNKSSGDITFDDVINSISLNLPKADTSFLKLQQESYTTYVTFIESAIDAYLSDGMINDMVDSGSKTPVQIQDIKTSILNLFKRNYLRSENMLPELDEMITNDNSGIGGMIEDHNKKIMSLADGVAKYIIKLDTKLNPPAEPAPDDLPADTDNNVDDDVSSDDDNRDNDKKNLDKKDDDINNINELPKD